MNVLCCLIEAVLRTITFSRTAIGFAPVSPFCTRERLFLAYQVLVLTGMDAETLRERRFSQDSFWNEGLPDFVSKFAPVTQGSSLARGPFLDDLSYSMDDEGRVGVRRRMICDQTALKLVKAIAERDAAILERNSAIAEKKAACVERDAALLRCDLAFSERDSALVERDAAVAALGAVRAGKFATFTEWTRHGSPNAVTSKTLQPPVVDSSPFSVDFASAAACQWKSAVGRTNICSEYIQKQSMAGNVRESQRDLRSKRKIGKDTKQGFLSSRKRPPEQKLLIYQRENLDQNERGSSVTEEVADENICNSIPYCSCTGVNQPCYKWGNGGWQSACCTTMISMYPLPMNPKKRSSRLAGRKMSAGAFEKLVEKLTLEGVNVRCPIDLKDHWAKHGTNRYVTLR
ncbi:protein MpBPCU [Marchantia polymorpha subsp. ruderalis]|uniref:GAGA-binding transcriptional activator n=1 Tax=Marchantia polymorpha TaxID=3197 RepID=A0A2R6XFD0_MARPO|nr:hypothetical protein MARPO_0018s0011 [Marchantia polymorpha]|eukprot:PTQ44814.1 hypothetical protein MARPO_0018s0011 [Marchantia polymorpha]